MTAFYTKLQNSRLFYDVNSAGFKEMHVGTYIPGMLKFPQMISMYLFSLGRLGIQVWNSKIN